jgi:inhibitor of cysteine peptidase
VEITLSEPQNGARLALGLDDTLLVRLTETSGAGYRWKLTSVDTAKLDMTEHRYEPTRAGIGSAGASVWRFTPKQLGRTRLELVKLRPGNLDDPAAERFAIELDIR